MLIQRKDKNILKNFVTDDSNLYFKLNLDIVKDISFSSNKSLNSGRFFAETSFKKPDWDKMLSDLYIDCENNNNLYNLK